MIQSTKGKLIENVLSGRAGKGFPSNIFRIASRKVAMMDAAVVLEDLRVPPANRLEVLKGDRAGQHSIRINNKWRICFIWTESGPVDVEITDYH
ncbi:MAG: type II toxin-antitoxin system RelE/ParE family toxin [Rhodobacteraceae bacterium]|nr:type II toxin-antitoxin system RelE/ParE family toxin [Paracoccaceae bacterium]